MLEAELFPRKFATHFSFFGFSTPFYLDPDPNSESFRFRFG